MIMGNRPTATARDRIRQAAKEGDLVAMSVVALEAELGHEATDWVFEDYGDDPFTMEFILRGMVSDD